MTSSQPYLIRAIHEWVVDNDLTPYLMVDGTMRGTIVPEEHLDELGRIILNISSTATSGLLMTNDEITFSARFSGQSMSIVVPTYSVRAIYARENGQGMIFDEGKEPTDSEQGAKRRATLEAVATGVKADAKSDIKDVSIDAATGDSKPSAPADGASKDQSDTKSSGKQSDTRKGKKGSHLKVIK